MNELQLVELGDYGVLVEVDEVNKLVDKQALDNELNRLAEGSYAVMRRTERDQLVVSFETYKNFVYERLNAC
jgi:hypothetical protein